MMFKKSKSLVFPANHEYSRTQDMITTPFETTQHYYFQIFRLETTLQSLNYCSVY